MKFQKNQPKREPVFSLKKQSFSIINNSERKEIVSIIRKY